MRKLWRSRKLNLVLAEFLTVFALTMLPVVVIGDVFFWRRFSKGHTAECPVIRSNPYKFYLIRSSLEMFLFLGGLWVGITIALH